jgi:carbon monoxide dehydrogenase subunit G
MIDADPSRVWALVADPERLREWAGVVTVGYMGTELPKPGQRVFVRSRIGLLRGRQRRVEIESWKAGSAVSCALDGRSTPTRFDLRIEPEMRPQRIATQIRLDVHAEVSAWAEVAAGWWIEMRLRRMLNRIARTVAE